MPEEMQPTRKGLRWKQFDYNSQNAYFLTICTLERKSILSTISIGSTGTPEVALSDYGEAVERCILSINKTGYAKVDHYVIMPDHVHLIICVRKSDHNVTTLANQTVPHVVSTFKRFCRKEIGASIFQRSYFDHVIRDREDYETRMKYVYDNPIKSFYEGKYD